MWVASENCRILFCVLRRRADSRTFWIAGNSNPIKVATMAMTTKSSNKVYPRLIRVLRNGGLVCDCEATQGSVTTSLTFVLIKVPSMAYVLISILTLVLAG